MEQPGVCIVPGTTRSTGAGTSPVLGPLQANGLVLIFISAKWGSFDLSDSTPVATRGAAQPSRIVRLSCCAPPIPKRAVTAVL